MKKLGVLACGLALLSGLTGSAAAFQEYPSLEVTPFVGFMLYDSGIEDYQSDISLGIRLDLRTISQLGFQFMYARSCSANGFPSLPFGKDEIVERIQFNLTRDLFLLGGLFVHGYAGAGSFNRSDGRVYENDLSLQAGLGARRNIVSNLYLRADGGWTGAFLDPEPPGLDRSLTHHFDVSLSLSYLFDN